MKLTLISLFLAAISFIQTVQADTFYTLQLSAAPTQHKTLAQHLSLPVMHRENFGPGQDFIYLGYFESEQDAQKILQQLHTQQPELKTYQPVIVEFFTSNTQPDIKTRPASTTAAAITNNTKAAKQQPKHTTEINSDAVTGPIYTVALAAFEYEETLLNFINKYSSNNLYCRQKNNGLYAVYWGIFNSHEHAKQGREIAQKIPDIKPYIVKFNDNDLNNCNTYKSAAVTNR
jgi:hypothetical protein